MPPFPSGSGETEPPGQLGTTSGREQGLPDQVVPGSDPLGQVLTANGAVGIAQDAHRAVEHVVVRVPVSRPLLSVEPTQPSQITLLLCSGEMDLAVVLLQGASADHPEVGAGKWSVWSRYVVLRLHLDAAEDEQQPEQGLPRRLRAGIGQGERLAQAHQATSTRHRAESSGKLLQVDVVGEHRSVQEHDHVDQAKVLCTREQDLDRGRNSNAVDDIERVPAEPGGCCGSPRGSVAGRTGPDLRRPVARRGSEAATIRGSPLQSDG